MKGDLTKGPVMGSMLRFAVPMILGNLLQQCYNVADTLIVGRFLGADALAAVGSSFALMTFLTSILLGLCMGSGACFSIRFGEGDEEGLKEGMWVSFVLIAGLALALTAAVYALLEPILTLLRVPPEVRPLMAQYLQVIFAGILATFLYNYFASLLRAVGNSVTPLCFLAVSAVLNIALDLFFVIGLGMKVEGVAYATILSQGVSAALILVVLARGEDCVRLQWKDLRVDWRILRQIIRIGVPSALQMAITSFSNVFVQSYINFFGLDCMSGWTTYSKLDQFIILPVQSLGLAATTFVGQNLGTDQVDRAKKGTRDAFFLSVGITVVISAAAIALAPWLVAFFNDKPEVVAYGTLFLRNMCPCYVFICVNQVYSGSLRGAGISQPPTYIMLASFVVFRQIYLYIMANYISNTILPIAMGYPAGWLVCSVLTLIYYNHVDLTGKRVVDDPTSMPEKS